MTSVRSGNDLKTLLEGIVGDNPERGYWLIFFVAAGETLYECNKIDYFSKEKYSPDPNDSTLAIPCLVMLLGLIMYISVFKAEVGSKLRTRSQLQPAIFTYHYGFSFLLYVSGFISTQLAGISAVFLFIYRMQHEWRRKHLEDIRRGKVRTPPPSINYVQLDHTMFYPCRRHPQAYINSNSSIHIPINFPSPVHQRRYFFSKEPIPESPCSIHHNRSQSNSLKDISSSFYDFPPPPTISYQFEELKSFNRDASRHFPRDITTNTVSTTADINCDDFLPEQYDDYSPSIQHEHEFVTFDLDQPLPIRAQSTVSVNSRNDNGKKDFSTDTLRRTTPV
ncbi:hypothetical protein ILUMI_09130 [Ignelater luminosus]|uniref:Uncharacterized protein n=1 Tax=Ignelater luminosus TaxID=2038154 RepID=A0A8K0D4W3_IGNLU|nr:hypothetical protein ILUMI_09130 [Ignelater luminosus]